MVIRDLTLRSAASFGSFHLIRLLYDEYMFYLVEHKVAAATSRTPIAVMSEVFIMSKTSIIRDPTWYDCNIPTIQFFKLELLFPRHSQSNSFTLLLS